MALLAASLHGIEAMIWAAAYRLIGALPDYNSAALYSLSAMTSYGHANLVLEKRWQLMGALEALNGVLLFGLTTAFLIGIIQSPGAPQREIGLMFLVHRYINCLEAADAVGDRSFAARRLDDGGHEERLENNFPRPR